jgi:T-complex protein 1 subunit theta
VEWFSIFVFLKTISLIILVYFAGQNKMVINHIEKLFVTNDAATILRELDVQHPAAKMIVLACQQQEQEVGDGTNFVMVFAGALLEQAESLLRMVCYLVVV